MTYYTRFREEQRNDQVLKDAIAQELETHRKDLEKVVKSLQVAYDVLLKTSQVDNMGNSYSRAYSARLDVNSAIQKLAWYEDFLKTVSDTYYGNIAAAMSLQEVEKLKEKYRD